MTMHGDNVDLNYLSSFIGLRQEAEASLRQQTGEAIRTARLSVGISQSTFADWLGVSQSYVSHVENGSKSVSTPQLQNMYSTLYVHAYSPPARPQAGGKENQ